MAKVLITGGAGFIGSHLADLLIAKGDEILVVDNLLLGREENIQHLFGHERFQFQKMDLLEFDQVKALFEEHQFTRVYHLAANSDIAKSNSERGLDLNLNLQTTRSVLEGMLACDCRELVFASTSAIYGELSSELHEDIGPLFPVSFYGASKLAAEAYISVYVNSYQIKAWITRFPNVVGERTTHGVIHDFIRKLRNNPNELEVLGDGNQFKPYLYVRELVAAIYWFTENSNEALNYVNIGVDSRTRVREIAAMVIEEMEVPAEIRYTGGNIGWVGDVAQFQYKLDKIHRMGWKADLTSNDAVRTAIRRILGKED